jgi:hypothetical protein
LLSVDTCSALKSDRKLEDQLDQKTAELIMQRKAAVHGSGPAGLEDSRSGTSDWTIPAVAAGQAPAAAQQQHQQHGPQPVVVEAGGYASSKAESPLGWHHDGPLGRGAAAAASSAAVEVAQRQLEELRLRSRRDLASAAEREAALRRQAQALQARLAQLEQRTQGQQQGQQQPSAGPAASTAARCEALSRERDALRVILEGKVQVLVDDVAASLAQLPTEVGRDACSCLAPPAPVRVRSASLPAALACKSHARVLLMH